MNDTHAAIIEGLAEELGWFSKPQFRGHSPARIATTLDLMGIKHWDWTKNGDSCVVYINDDGCIVIFDNLLYRENERSFQPDPIKLELCDPNLIERLRDGLNEYCATRRPLR